MADQRQPLSLLPDDGLGQALRELGASVAFPSPGAAAGTLDLAAIVRRRLELSPPRPSAWRRSPWGVYLERRSARVGARPARRGLVLALVALLVLAAVAGAVGFGLPGLRILFGEGPGPQPSPAPTFEPSASGGVSPSGALSPLGSTLALGTALPLADVERLAGFDLVMPTDPDLGPPDAAYLNGARAALVWASRPDLPETLEPGVGLVLSEFRGRMTDGYFQKTLGGGTTLTPVTVGGSPGYWINGDPHFFFYVDPQGKDINDDHRVVGDVLLWTSGEVTYRLETSLGLAAATKLAESLR